jgi:tRNA pseudouridine55 synthase
MLRTTDHGLLTMHGLLVLDKPVGITSRDAVDRALAWFPRKTRVGHTGTLDPLASGVLVLCIRQATRLTEYIQNMAKTYVADVMLGARSATDDAEGPISPVTVDAPPNRAAVDEALMTFVGQVKQVPPAFSAAKVTGRRAYSLARQGVEIELAPRTVRIDAIETLAFDYPRVRLEIRCGRGTYIRSLARDLGERLCCGGYVDKLRRTSVGPFTTDMAVPLNADVATAHARILPLAAAVAELPSVTLTPDAVTRLRNGQSASAPITSHGEFAVFDATGALVAIAGADQATQSLRPLKVFSS